MKLIPVFTEKSTSLVKEGKYTFDVDVTASKYQIRNQLFRVFGVHAVDVRTVKTKGESKKSLRGKKVWIPARKKAIISIKEGEKLEVFEGKKSK